MEKENRIEGILTHFERQYPLSAAPNRTENAFSMHLRNHFGACAKPFYGFDALTSIILCCNLTLITVLPASDCGIK